MPHQPIAQCPQCHEELTRPAQRIRRAEDLRFCPRCQLPSAIIAGKYLLTSQLAEGGGGILYLARHLILPTQASRVIKFLKPELLASPQARKRFIREMQITSTISEQNDHIVRVFDDIGEVPRLGFYYVMEHIEGIRLDEFIHNYNAPASTETILAIFAQICRAIETAHKADIIHRDLKSENIILTQREGHDYFVKVLDFGIARQMQEVRLTQDTNSAFGTPSIMAPEQWLGQEVDRRTDIYSLGILLYEMVTSENPFYRRDGRPETAMSIGEAHVYQPPPPMRTIRPERSIPAFLEALVAKALAKRPEDRFQSIGEMLRFLNKHKGDSLLAKLQKDIESPSSPSYDQHASPLQLQPHLRNPLDPLQTLPPGGSSPHYPSALPQDPGLEQGLAQLEDASRHQGMRAPTPVEVSAFVPTALASSQQDVQEYPKIAPSNPALTSAQSESVIPTFPKEVPVLTFTRPPEEETAADDSSDELLVAAAFPGGYVIAALALLCLGVLTAIMLYRTVKDQQANVASTPPTQEPTNTRDASARRTPVPAAITRPRVPAKTPTPKRTQPRRRTPKRSKPKRTRRKRRSPVVRRVPLPPRPSPKRRNPPKAQTPGCPSDSNENTWIRVEVSPTNARVKTSAVFIRHARWFCLQRKKQTRRIQLQITAPRHQPCAFQKPYTKRKLRLALKRDASDNPLDSELDYCAP